MLESLHCERFPSPRQCFRCLARDRSGVTRRGGNPVLLEPHGRRVEVQKAQQTGTQAMYRGYSPRPWNRLPYRLYRTRHAVKEKAAKVVCWVRWKGMQSGKFFGGNRRGRGDMRDTWPGLSKTCHARHSDDTLWMEGALQCYGCLPKINKHARRCPGAAPRTHASAARASLPACFCPDT